MRHRRIVNDVSFQRFVKALVAAVKEQPSAQVTATKTQDDPRAEFSFMFIAVLEWEE